MAILGQEPITRRRRADGSYVSGRWVAGAATDSTIQAGVQPASGQDLQLLEEGFRTREALFLLTETELRGLNQTSSPQLPADQVVIDSKVYDVHHVDHTRSILPYYGAVVVRVQEQPA